MLTDFIQETSIDTILIGFNFIHSFIENNNNKSDKIKQKARKQLWTKEREEWEESRKWWVDEPKREECEKEGSRAEFSPGER